MFTADCKSVDGIRFVVTYLYDIEVMTVKQ